MCGRPMQEFFFCLLCMHEFFKGSVGVIISMDLSFFEVEEK